MPNSKATLPVVPVVLQLDTMELSETGDWSCPTCHCGLDLSQPSAQNPDMLLGTCAQCDGWFLFYQHATSPQCRILRIPTAAELESASPAKAPAARSEPASRVERSASPRGSRRG